MNPLLKTFQAKLNPTVVTLPNYEELSGNSLVLTDYAMATGGRCCRSLKNRANLIANYGAAWTRISSTADMVDCAMPHHYGQCSASDRRVGVIPHFQNPASQRIGVRQVDLRAYLTIGDELVYYPQSHVDFILSAKLNKALATNTEIQLVGNFRSDKTSAIVEETSFCDYAEISNWPYQPQNNLCYLYQGQYYVHLEHAKQTDTECMFSDGTKCEADHGYWFLCGPIRAKQLDDGSIQCQDILCAAQFETREKFHSRGTKDGQPSELDVSKFQIGKFLNHDFWHDLQFGAKLVINKRKLTECRQDAFCRSALELGGKTR